MLSDNSSAQAQDPAEGEQATLEYARNVHDEIIRVNTTLLTRAQWIITLDGVFVGLLGSGLLTSPDDLRGMTQVFSPMTWGTFLGSGVAIVCSLICALTSMQTLHTRGPKNNNLKLTPKWMWFFKHIAEFGDEAFVDAAKMATKKTEIQARLWQCAIMAPLMVKRAFWVNLSFASAALAFTFLAWGVADYTLRAS